MALKQKVYEEAKRYALAVLMPYVGQRFWHDNHMYMIHSLSPGHRLNIERCVQTGMQWDESISFSDHWDRLNRHIWRPWRGNEIRTR